MRKAVPFLDVPVHRVMTPRPATIGPEDSLGDAAGVMVEGGFRHLPVVDPDGAVVGMLSERDLRARLGTELERFADAARDLLSEEVEGTLRPDPITIPSTATVRDALEILADERIGALPVLDGERLVGILSYLDLLVYLRGEAPPAPAREVEAPQRQRRSPSRKPPVRKPPSRRTGARGGRRRAAR
ncbi:CBS domain-containing protein [Anaeromyxobacter terrae]|uniref:CBS domain-containing protein n=1 Tax=Anaeromyxobacter terrae TaxID=2925406 RepID=UPI001F5A6B72|nr:CBS domain-containing protein [Anaeromyxobacter sp. SG22]